VNRSRRRAAVTSWTVTAGVLCATGGLGAVVSMGLAAPARADPAVVNEAPADGNGSPDADRSRSATGGPPRARRVPGIRPVDSTAQRQRPGRAIGPTTEVAGENTRPVGTPEWPCPIPWPVWPVPAYEPPEGAAPDSDSQPSLPLVPPTMPLAWFPATTERPLPGFGIDDPDGSAAPGAVAVGVSPAVPPAAAPQESVQSVSVTAGRIPPTPLAGMIAPPAAPPSRPDAAARPPEGSRPGYPTYLREADIADVAALALPGLAGLLGITAFGGFLGYRQAKAGYALPAGGIARFLQ